MEETEWDSEDKIYTSESDMGIIQSLWFITSPFKDKELIKNFYNLYL